MSRFFCSVLYRDTAWQQRIHLFPRIPLLYCVRSKLRSRDEVMDAAGATYNKIRYNYNWLNVAQLKYTYVFPRYY
jgi:hypothetical protein